jgi:drug/metabolite transporter (DMT)-like permease
VTSPRDSSEAPAARSDGRLLSADSGSHQEAYGPAEWGLVSTTSLIWGASFLFIAVSLEAFSPGVIAFLRVVLGAATLALFSRARTRIARPDRGRIIFVGVIGIALPAYLFAVAEQSVDSAVAGMLVSGVPIVSAAIFALVTKRLPGPRQRLGLLIGIVGILMLTLPELQGAQAAPLGVGLVLLAVVGYGVSNNVYVPIGRRYGALAVQLWSQIAALVVLVPAGLLGWSDSTFAIRPAMALVALGVLGTGIARAAHVELVTRVGPARGTISAYIIPVVALILGVVLLNDQVAPLQIAGVAIALLGGWLISRRA